MDEYDDEPWPFRRPPRAYPRPGRASGDETHEQRLTGHVQRHWERAAQPPRRDRRLSQAEIVATAIAVADAEGPDAISMRPIARELGAGAMSLYWHVGSKEELLDLVLESIEAEAEVPGAVRRLAGRPEGVCPPDPGRDEQAQVGDGIPGRQATVRTADELQAESERYRKWFEASGRYPRIARFMEAGIDPNDPETRDERFEFGLDCVLDGIAARLQVSRG